LAAVMAVFCERLGDWLEPSRKDAMLAARVFTALVDPALPDELGDPLYAAFEQVREWNRRDLSVLGRMLSSKAEVAKQFKEWRESQHVGLARKLFGGMSRSAEER